jgi:hypothetical protein
MTSPLSIKDARLDAAQLFVGQDASLSPGKDLLGYGMADATSGLTRVDVVLYLNIRLFLLMDIKIPIDSS